MEMKNQKVKCKAVSRIRNRILSDLIVFLSDEFYFLTRFHSYAIKEKVKRNDLVWLKQAILNVISMMSNLAWERMSHFFSYAILTSNAIRLIYKEHSDFRQRITFIWFNCSSETVDSCCFCSFVFSLLYLSFMCNIVCEGEPNEK
jgi:hypothetical protein